MSTLITGATGFVGLNVAEALLKRGETVLLFSRRSIKPDTQSGQQPTPPAAFRIFSKLQGNIRIVTGDIRDQDRLEQILAEYSPENIVHGAAITPGLTRERDQMQLTADVNFMGTLCLLEAACKFKVRRIIYLSSGAVYGQSSFAAEILKEDVPIPLPDTIYAVSKYAGERASLRYRQIWNMDVVAARLGTVFGPWEWDTGIRATLSTLYQVTSRAVRGEPAILPQISGRKDWVYSRDIANAIVSLIDSSDLPHDVYNLGSGTIWEVNDWCKKLSEYFLLFTYRMTDQNKEINCDYGTVDRSPLSIQRLERDTGFVPSFGLEEAFTDYMQWIDGVPEFWH